jgi:cysteine-rich repeat protein
VIVVAMTTGLACTNDYDALGKAAGASTGGGSASSASGGPTSGSMATTSSGSVSTTTGGGSGLGGAGGSASTGTGGDGGGSASSTGTSGEGGGSASSTTGTGGDGGGGAGPVCGDDSTDPPEEECDDGALIPGDGCGPTCLVEEPDTCPGTPIPLEVGTLDIAGDTSGADDTLQDSDGQGPCTTTPSAGPDFIYAVTPGSGGTLTATLDSSFDYHWLRARLGCPSGAELDCNYAMGAGSDIQITFAVQTGETYYVVVDSWNGTQGGPFTLRLELSP